MTSTDRPKPTRDHFPYRAVIGVGGIGSGLLLALEGNHDLGRNESRPARLMPVRDYCKLHIIAHYLAALLGARPSGSFVHVIPIGKVGNDSEGLRLKTEMADVGMDTEYVEVAEGKPTLFSICYQYPDQTGGNITTSQSAASSLTNKDIDRVIPLLESYGNRWIALAVPEVPLEVRHHLLKLATSYQGFRVASLTPAEIQEARTADIFSDVDLLAINEDEAAALIGRTFNPHDPREFLEQCAVSLTASQPHINIVVTAGKNGVFAFADGCWSHFASLPVKAISTTGAGDALLAGILTALIAGAPLINNRSPSENGGRRSLGSAIDFGILLASFSVTSPHTIHPDATMKSLLEFADDLGMTFTDVLSQIVPEDDLTLRKAL
jgi:sugar/nucleoside kinase (ribokinase family)